MVVAEQDTFGNVETGDSSTALTLGANNGGGGFTCATTPSHVTAGVATFSNCRYTVASVTAYTLTAASAGLTSATANTTVSPGAATKLVYTTAPPASTTAGSTFSVVVAEQDAIGNVETADSSTALDAQRQQRRRRALLHDRAGARDQRRRDLHRLQLHDGQRVAPTR